MKDQKTPNNSIRRSKKRKRKKDFRIIDLIAVVFLAFFAILAVNSIKDYIDYQILDFSQSASGTLSDNVKVKALVIREEYPVEAPEDGSFLPILTEGDRVKEGTAIGYIESYSSGGYNRFEVLSDRSGTVHYQTDGLEEMLSPSSFRELDLDRLFSEMESFLNPQQEDEDIARLNNGKGHTVAKIIDNLLDYTVIFSYQGEDIFPAEGDISFYLNDGDELYQGKIIDRLHADNHTYLVLQVFPGYQSLTEKRFFEAEAILSQFTGTIIPLSAIYEDESGKTGVYQQYLGNLVFSPVEILGIIGEEAAVTGIDPNKAIVVNPDKAYAGQKVY